MVGPPQLTETTNQIETPELGLWQLIKEDWNAHGRDWTKKTGISGSSSSKVRRLEDAGRTTTAAGSVEHSVQIALLKSPQHLLHRFAVHREARPPGGD